MKTYVCAARSQNTNGFGLRGYIFVANDGTAVEAASGHFDHYPGDRVEVQDGDPVAAFANAGYEIPQTKPKAPPAVVKAIWRIQPPARQACSECHRNVPASDIKDGKCPSCQPKPEGAWDEVGFIMAYEGGELDDEAVADGFQHLIDSHTIEHLQGHYGRTAVRLIEAGHCQDTHGYFTGAKV